MQTMSPRYSQTRQLMAAVLLALLVQLCVTTQALANAGEDVSLADTGDALALADAGEDASRDIADDEVLSLEDLGEDVFLTEATDEVLALNDADADSTPTIGIAHVPAYGTEEYVLGEVRAAQGTTLDPTAYRVTLFVQVEAGQAYWVKPTADNPYVEVQADGSFSLDYVSYYTDKAARYLHVLLIPATYTPTVNGYTQALEHALDHVAITRAQDGTYMMDPSDRDEPSLFAGMPSGITASPTKIAVDVGLYTSGNPGDNLSDAHIRTFLERTAEFAHVVRFYDVSGCNARACAIAHELGLDVIATAALTGDADNDQAQMDALVGLCDQGYVQVACVGNETLYANLLTPEELVDDLNYVRDKLADKSIPVTTSETLGLLIDYPIVRNACDILMPNVYPFWEGTSVGSATASFEGMVHSLANSSPGKEILVSETGWPTAGGTNGSAVSGETQARTYFEGIRAWSVETQTVVLWFEAADETWKSGPNGEGPVGSHWGLMDTQLHVKDGFASLSLFDSLMSKTETLQAGDVTLGTTSYTYDGKAKTPAVTVKHGGTTLTRGTDYTVSYANNKNAGTASVTVEGVGAYAGSVTKTFTISKASQSLTAKLSATSIYAGKTAKVTTSGGIGKLTYTSNKTSVATTSGATVTGKGYGTATITVKAAGDANHKTASKNLSIKVTCSKPAVSTVSNANGGMKVTWGKVTGAVAYRVFCKTGSGAWKKVGDTTSTSYVAKTSNGTTALKTGTKYSFTVRCVLKSGSSTYTSAYDTTGKAQVYVAAATLSSVGNTTSKTATATWKKVSGVTGYKLQYCTSKSFSSGVKTITATGATKTSAKIGSLTKGKTYYVRVRSYKTISGKTYYSVWSGAKSVTIKK